MCYTIIKDKGYTNNTKEITTMTKFYVVCEDMTTNTIYTYTMTSGALASLLTNPDIEVLYSEKR